VVSQTLLEARGSKCNCFTKSGDINNGTSQQTAHRKNSRDNYIYWPTATDVQNGALDHFQEHLSKGQPVIVRDVLKLTCGLSWEPMVLFRAFQQKKSKNNAPQLLLEATECMTGRKVTAIMMNIDFIVAFVQATC
jgi:lysine-specific demethylase 3